MPADARIHKMSEMINEKIDEVNPNIIVLEDTQQQAGNIQIVKILSRLQGVIMGMCYGKHINYKIMAPSTWRSMLEFKQGKGVKRTELKAQSIEYVKDKFDIKVTDDESDAICIGLAYIKKYLTEN